jgi:hypothetical protein
LISLEQEKRLIQRLLNLQLGLFLYFDSFPPTWRNT